MNILKEQGIAWGEYTAEHKKQDDLVVKRCQGDWLINMKLKKLGK